MDISKIPPADLQFFRSQGYSDSDIEQYAQPPQQQAPQQESKLQTIENILKAHAGGLAGGSGAIPGMMYGSALGPPGTIIGGIIGGLGGSYLGQHAQQAVESPETYSTQQAAAEQSAHQNPITAGLTDLTAGALASGGLPSPTTGVKGVGSIIKTIGSLGKTALTDEGKNVAIQAAINPAISTGVSLAQGQGIPSLGSLAEDAAGGAMFAKSWLPQGRTGVKETKPDVTNKDEQQLPPEEKEEPATTKWNEQDADGNYLIGNKQIKQMYLKRTVTPVDKTLPDVEQALAGTKNDSLRSRTDYDQMRQELHEQELVEQAKKEAPQQKTEEEPQKTAEEDYQGGEMPSQKGWEPTPEVTSKSNVEKILGGESQLTSPTREVTQPQPQAQQKPITPNQARIINPETLLQSDVSRPEQIPTDIQDRVLHNETEEMTPEEIAQEKMMTEKSAPQDDKPTYIGHQQDFTGKTPGFAMFNLKTPIVDETGKVLHAAGSTVSEGTLKKNGVDYETPEKTKAIGSAQPHSPDHVQTSSSLMQHILSGKATVETVLHSLANTPNHPFQQLAKHLFEHADSVGKQVRIVSGHIADGRSAYVRRNDSEHIEMHTPHLADSRILMEEIVHALTVKKLPEFGYKTGKDLADAYHKYIADPKGNSAVKELLQAHMDTAKHRGQYENFFGKMGTAGNADMSWGEHSLKGEPMYGYAMGNIKEFVAHAFKDLSFQRILNRLPSDVEGKSIWQKIKDAVSKLLGVPVQSRGMLEKVLDHSMDLIGQERPSRYAGESVARSAPTEKDRPPASRLFGKLGNITKAVVDKVGELNHPGAKPLHDALKQTLNEQDSLRGRWRNAVVEAGQRLSPKDKLVINQVKNYELSQKKSGAHLLQNDAQKNYYSVAKKAYSDNGDYRIKNNEPVMQNGQARLLKKDPSYWAGMANQKVEEVYRTNTDQQAISVLDKQFDLWNQQHLGLTPAESKNRIAAWKVALQGDLKGNTVSHQDYFNASRKAMGSPLPPEFREQDPVKNDARYFDRQAIDNSHYKFIESNPKAMAALGEQKDAWGRKITPYSEGSLANNGAVKSALQQFRGAHEGISEKNEASVSGLATSAFIANPALESHKVVSNQVKALAFAESPLQMARMLAHGMMNIKSGYQHAKENGVVKLSASSARDMLNGSLTASERMVGAAKAIRDVSTLGGLTTKVNAGLLQAQMEYLIPSKIQRANSGDKTAQEFIKNLDPTYTKGKDYSDTEQQALASQAANYIHGTGDIRSMPAWMMNDGEVSGFFKLAHWSVAQTNNFVKDVWTPAQRGDIKPLLFSVFGSVAGGYLIKELREDIQGKHSPIPSLSEIAAGEGGLAGNKSLLMYNAIAAMQYSGFGGLLSQVAKYPFDFAYKNSPQGATFPLDEVASDLAETLKNVSSSIANDPNINWVDLAAAVTQHMLSSNFQLTRIAINQGINNGLITGLPAEKKQLSDSMAKLRRFDMVAGLPYADMDAASNPYMNIEQKKFKSTQDVGEAMKELPSLVQNIMTTYHDKPDVMMSKLEALKQNQYSTFPSMEKMPLSFMKYVAYLQREEGPEAAQSELQDYLKHKVINEVKSSVVP